MPIKLKNIYFLIVLIFSGLATCFYRSQPGIIFIFLLSIGTWIYYKKPLKKSYLRVIGIWLLYCLIVYLRNGELTPFFYFRYVTYITVAYVTINLLRDQLFYKFERTVYILAFISLFFYVWQVLSPGSLFQLARMLDISGEMGRSSVEYRNFLIFTVENHGAGSMQRNYGFAFEPGTYSVYLTLAMAFNLLRTKMKLSIRQNPPLYIMGIALITTFSTTGYLGLGTLITYLIFKDVKSKAKYVYFLLSLGIVIFLYFRIDFMQSKINELFISGQNVEEVIDRAAETGNSYSGGRFGGFLIAWEDFKQRPLFGRGGLSDLTVGATDGGHVAIINGLANILSKLGLFGLIVYLIALYKSSLGISTIFNSKAIFAIFLVILIGSVAFSIHKQFILFTFIFYSLFCNHYKKVQ